MSDDLVECLQYKKGEIPNLAVPHNSKDGVNAWQGIRVSLDVVEACSDRVLSKRLGRYIITISRWLVPIS